ncbi:MAG TPA: hypothetical protein VIE43_21920 [Thermoanaerobaculia bacterium]|nr:hypothetical protein [Thermoanaerobaculia bacterium]
MKKQIKKLSIQRETLTTLALQGVAAGGTTDFCGTSKINDTVYHPQPTLNPPTTVINA